MRGRTPEIRTLSLSAVRTSHLDPAQTVDLQPCGHSADCPPKLSVQPGGGHSPPLGAVRPAVRPHASSSKVE